MVFGWSIFFVVVCGSRSHEISYWFGQSASGLGKQYSCGHNRNSREINRVRSITPPRSYSSASANEPCSLLSNQFHHIACLNVECVLSISKQGLICWEWTFTQHRDKQHLFVYSPPKLHYGAKWVNSELRHRMRDGSENYIRNNVISS